MYSIIYANLVDNTLCRLKPLIHMYACDISIILLKSFLGLQRRKNLIHDKLTSIYIGIISAANSSGNLLNVYLSFKYILFHLFFQFST